MLKKRCFGHADHFNFRSRRAALNKFKTHAPITEGEEKSFERGFNMCHKNIKKNIRLLITKNFGNEFDGVPLWKVIQHLREERLQ